MKTPKYILKALEMHDSQIRAINELLEHKKRTDVELMDWLKNTSEDKLIGRAEGASVMMSEMLHHANCYRGFGYLDEKCDRLIDPGEEMVNWRIMYFRR